IPQTQTGRLYSYNCPYTACPAPIFLRSLLRLLFLTQQAHLKDPVSLLPRSLCCLYAAIVPVYPSPIHALRIKMMARTSGFHNTVLKTSLLLLGDSPVVPFPHSANQSKSY